MMILVPLAALALACDPTPGGCFALCVSEDGPGGFQTASRCDTESTPESCEANAQAACDAAELPLADFAYSAECACDESCASEVEEDLAP